LNLKEYESYAWLNVAFFSHFSQEIYLRILAI